MSDKAEARLGGEAKRIDRLSGEEAPRISESVDYDKFLDFLRSKDQRHEKRGIVDKLKRPFSDVAQAMRRRGEEKKEAQKAEAARLAEQAKKRQVEALESEIISIALDPLRKQMVLVESDLNLAVRWKYDPGNIPVKLNKIFFSGSIAYGRASEKYSDEAVQQFGLPESADMLLNYVTIQKSPYIDTLVETAFTGEARAKVENYAKLLGISLDEAKEKLDLEIAKSIIGEYMAMKGKILRELGHEVKQQPPPPSKRKQINIEE